MTGMGSMALGGQYSVTVSIDPDTDDQASSFTDTQDFFPTALCNFTPSAYSWGVVSGTGGGVQANGTTATPTLRIVDPVQGDGPQIVTFYCDMTVFGVVYRAECTYSFDWQV